MHAHMTPTSGVTTPTFHMDLDGELASQSLVRGHRWQEGVAYLSTLLPHNIAIYGVFSQPQAALRVNTVQVMLQGTIMLIITLLRDIACATHKKYLCCFAVHADPTQLWGDTERAQYKLLIGLVTVVTRVATGATGNAVGSPLAAIAMTTQKVSIVTTVICRSLRLIGVDK